MTAPTKAEQETEIIRLRARVAALEQELVEQAERSHRIVAESQERLYWLDRWHVDLNELMRRRGAAEFRGAVRILRGVLRRVKRIKRRLLPGS
jgi:hypothetical protein